MNIQHKHTKQSGFAIIEAIFAIIIIALVVGGGIYLFQRKQADARANETSQTGVL